MNQKELSVIIVSYNVKDFLLAAIASVYNHVTFSFEIIVIDNNSSDNSIEAIKEKYPEVITIENKDNKGFSEANNQGFEIANGDFILMLNPDAELLDNNIVTAKERILNSKANILVGPGLQNPDSSLQVSAWRFQNVFAHLLEAFFLNKLFYPFNYSLAGLKDPMKVDSISGACILMKRDLIQTVGGLDNNLFWMDDVDLCYRVKKTGGDNLYFPNWQVKHFIGESSKKNFNIVIANQIISKLKFYKKHKQYLNFIFSIPVFQIHILLRILFLTPLCIINSSVLKKLKAYLYTQKRFFQYLFLNKQSVS